MNYIKHLNKVMTDFYGDARISSNHISIYLALFKNANDNRFENPFPIYRQEIMKSSKVYSISTYTRCLQQLDEWGYIQYKTSNNPRHGTQVHLYDFGNTAEKSAGNTVGNTPERSLGNSSENTDGNTIPYRDNLNNTKDVKEIPPTLDEVILYFLEQKFPEKEAKKFFNHFQSNGWKVSGKTPMQDWQAAAQNWMLNADKFNSHGRENRAGEPKAGHLHTGNNKDYSEPL